MQDKAIWKTAPPLWRDGLAGTIELDRPAILRFDTDDFMTRLQTDLDLGDEHSVGDYVLRSETWRDPAVGLPVPVGADVPRLYQPTHGRFYLVTGGLVCERYGLPDKAVHPNCGESVFAVLRRLEPLGAAAVDPRDRATYREFGWVPAGSGGNWAGIADGLAVGEERLPMFPMTYLDEHRRRLLATMVPVSARERYEGALPDAAIDPDSDDPAAVLALPGRARLEQIVLSLEALLQLASQGGITNGEPTSVTRYREATFFALVDLAAFLAEELPAVWANTTLAGKQRDLADLLTGSDFGTGAGSPTWLSALRRADANRNVVLADAAAPPSPVTGESVGDIEASLQRLGVEIPNPDLTTTLDDPFFVLVHAALDEVVTPAPSIGAAGGTGSGVAGPPPSRMEGAVYVARLVYERPRCRPPQRHTISVPTEAFRLAHFYDSDAPFRDNRIVLPIDTSLQGLRKFPQAVKLDFSSQLRNQMDRIQAIKLADLDSGDIHAEKKLDLGMVCSLSIPIITICALVLLMIIVSLLNIVFFWIPLFKICLPKGSS